MIDTSMIDKNRLIDIMLDDISGNVNAWIKLVEIVPDYVPPFPRAGDRPSIQVRCLVRPDEPAPGPGIATSRYSYLRASGIAGWKSGGYFWDCYGTAWLTVEYAFLAVLHAPVPPGLLSPLCWNALATVVLQPAASPSEIEGSGGGFRSLRSDDESEPTVENHKIDVTVSRTDV